MPGFLTHRDCEIINIDCFELQSFAVICYAAIDNEYTDGLCSVSILKKKLIKECENAELDLNLLPDPKMYREANERNEFQKRLLLDSYHNLNEMYLSEVKNAQKAWESSNNAWAIYEELKKKEI